MIITVFSLQFDCHSYKLWCSRHPAGWHSVHVYCVVVSWTSHWGHIAALNFWLDPVSVHSANISFRFWKMFGKCGHFDHVIFMSSKGCLRLEFEVNEYIIEGLYKYKTTKELKCRSSIKTARTFSTNPENNVIIMLLISPPTRLTFTLKVSSNLRVIVLTSHPRTVTSGLVVCLSIGIVCGLPPMYWATVSAWV